MLINGALDSTEISDLHFGKLPLANETAFSEISEGTLARYTQIITGNFRSI